MALAGHADVAQLAVQTVPASASTTAQRPEVHSLEPAHASPRGTPMRTGVSPSVANAFKMSSRNADVSV
jgi:hypothetical protein